MANANYSTDLTTIDTVDTTSNLVEPTGSTAGGAGGGSQAVQETDFFIQGTACASKTYNATGVGGFGTTAGSSINLPTDGAFYVWGYWAAPNSLASKASGGYQVLVGQSTSIYRRYYVQGSDTNIYGGWRCYVANPSVTSSANQGTPNTTTTSMVGFAVNNTTAISKGNPFGFDVVRYGRGSIITTGGTTGSPGNFTEMARFNDRNETGAESGFTLLDSGYHRLGIFTSGGGVYTLQGRLLFGETGGSASTFTELNKSIIIDECEFATTNFNTLEFQNASSVITFSNVAINSRSTSSPGNILMTDNCSLTLNGCTFLSMGTITLLSNATLQDSVLRACTVLNTNNATITGNRFNVFTAASSISCNAISDINNITGNTFISDGSNHAVTASVPAGTSNITWDNFLTNYVSGGSGGSNVGNTSGTGNEALYLTGTNTATVNISVSDGATIPSVRTDSSNVTVNVTAGQRTFTVTNIVSGSEVRLYKQSDLTELAGVESIGSVTGGDTLTVSGPDVNGRYSGSYTYSYSADTPIYVVVHSLSYLYDRKEFTLEDADSSLQISQVADRNYSNP